MARSFLVMLISAGHALRLRTASDDGAWDWESIQACLHGPTYTGTQLFSPSSGYDETLGRLSPPAGYKHWSYHSVPQIIAALENRHVVFMGDSIMQHSFVILSCALQSQLGISSSTYTEHHEVQHFDINDKNITLEFLGSGLNWRKNGRRSYDLIAEIPWYFSRLRTRDVMVINVGVHETGSQMYEDTYHGQHVHDSATIPEFRKADAGAQLQDLKDTALVVAKLASKSTGPKMFWRETTPQHWATSNGYYTPLASKEQCSPINDKTLAADPRNQIANSILEGHKVPIIRTREALLPMYNLHREGECTHWTMNVYELLNEMFLNTFENA